MTIHTSTLALARFVEGAFTHAGLSPELFNADTPLSIELLSLVGEDLLYHEILVDAAEEGLSIREMLRGEKESYTYSNPTAQLRWTRAQRGSTDLEDLCGSEVYKTLCRRRGEQPREFITRARARADMERRARAKREIAKRLRS